jgi:putative component of toxin-antitoxin plasmid stabilization module
MSKTGPEHVTLATGPKGVIIGVRLPNESCPSEDFLAGLNTAGQTQFKARFERLTQIGYLRNPDQMRPLHVAGEPKVWEIKVPDGPGRRLYVVRVQMTWVATHGSDKPSEKLVSNEVHRARTIFEEWTP